MMLPVSDMAKRASSGEVNSDTMVNYLPFSRTAAFVQSLCLALSDMAILAIAAFAAWRLKLWQDPSLPVEQYVQVLPLVLCAQLLVFSGLGLYPALGFGPAEELRRLSYATTVVMVVSMAVTFVTKAGEAWSRQIMLLAWGLSLVAIPLARSAVRRICCRQAWWGIPCVVIGAGATGQQVINLLRSRPWLGLRPVVIVDDAAENNSGSFAEVPMCGPVREKMELLAGRGIHHGLLAIPTMRGAELSRMLDMLGDHLRHVHIVPALPGCTDVIAETREFANSLVLEVRQNLLRPGARFLKRFLDLLAIIFGGACIVPVVLGIMLLVKITSSGPIFYGQNRIGRGGREFKAWKFRSMVRDADVQLKMYLEAHPELREEWERDHKIKNDPRVTWIGSILRRTSLDELPQLWNILKGEMSLVGPRPIVQKEVEKYGERFTLYKKVLPGLSGLWQVSGRNDTTYAERVALDCYYVRNWSVWLDLVILASTVRVVLRGKGAY
jgi:Undecaprenyl-phosphate galactose phosphotransferase WbaP